MGGLELVSGGQCSPLGWRSRAGLARRTLGYSTRAGSAAGAALRDLYRRIERYLYYYLPRDTPAELASGLFAGAEALGVRRNFGYSAGDIMDDHTPLHVIARISAMDIIDFDYPPWHTSADTLDKLSAASLQTIGRVVLRMLASL